MSDNSRSTQTRRGFLVTAGAAGALSIAGCSGSDSGVTFILNPASANVDIKVQYKPLIDYLESETGATIETKRANSYNATLTEIERGAAELADTGPFGAVTAQDQLDVVGIRVAFGADKYFSLITTTTDTNIQSVSDLQDKKVVFADQLSTSGTLFPLKMLSDAGLDIGDAPQGSPNDFEVAGYTDHTTAKEQLINRPEIAAAGTAAFSTGAHVPQSQFDSMSDQFAEIAPAYEDAGSADPPLNLVAISQPIPRAPIVARSSWSGSTRDEVVNAMLNAEAGGEAFTHDNLLSELNTSNKSSEEYENHQLWFSNIKKGSFDDYQPVMDVREQLGISPSDLEGE